MLSTENFTSANATQYRELRQLSFAKIKQKYEDIGDFFDEALKPFRVKLREETKAVALRHAGVFQNFLKLACPNNPQVIDQVMNHVRAKVNLRFEGGAIHPIGKSSDMAQSGGFLYLRLITWMLQEVDNDRGDHYLWQADLPSPGGPGRPRRTRG